MTNDIHSPSPSPSSWEELPNEHLPRPTYFPAGVAMGLTFLFWGLITSYITALVGLGLFAAAFAGWIREIRHEHHR
jgi:hypothetical protein